MCRYCDDLDDSVERCSAAGHPPASEWFWTELAIMRARWNVLRHPFYLRWSAGELTMRELARYAAQYLHLTVALASVSRNAVDKADGLLADVLTEHAVEEQAHVDLWLAFADAAHRETTWLNTADALPETLECSRIWAGDESRPLELDLVSLYAIEAPQSEIAQTKLDGLLSLYGFTAGRATEYFRVHSTRDREHAALAGAALEGLLPTADPFVLLRQADAVQRGYWQMLDRLEHELTS
jgi:pyrroloquinoline-quinone synthase